MERCEMDRINEMEEFLQEAEEILLKERMDRIKSICMNEKDIKEEVLTIVKELAAERTEGCIVISFLRGSYVTGSHEFCIAYYEDEPFVEEEPDSRFYSLRLLFEGIEDDFIRMNKELGNKYIRIFASEKEEIRRWFMEKIYMRLGEILKLIFEGVQTDKNLDIFFGNYMGELDKVN